MLYKTLFVLASVTTISSAELQQQRSLLQAFDNGDDFMSTTGEPGTTDFDSDDSPSTTDSSSASSDSDSSDSASASSASDDSASSNSESGDSDSNASESNASGDSDNSTDESTSDSVSVADDDNSNSIDDDVEVFSVDESGEVVGSADSNDDLDEDGKTNSQDSDDDGDGIPDLEDSDDDDDGVPDSQDNDDDNDGTPDSQDNNTPRRVNAVEDLVDAERIAAQKAKETTSELYTVIGVLGGIIGALLIVVGGSGYYLYQKNVKDNEAIHRAVEMVDVENNAMPQTFSPENGEYRDEDPIIVSQ